MMRPLPFPISLARLTKLPGEFSTSSTVGMESPAETMIAAVDENGRVRVRVRVRVLVLVLGRRLRLKLVVFRRAVERCREKKDADMVGTGSRGEGVGLRSQTGPVNGTT